MAMNNEQSSKFPPLDGSAPVTKRFASMPPMGIDSTKRYSATLETTIGTMVIALDAAAAPLTVNNFVYLAAHHYYDGVIFHRIIKNFMCQGGDPEGSSAPCYCPVGAKGEISGYPRQSARGNNASQYRARGNAVC